MKMDDMAKGHNYLPSDFFKEGYRAPILQVIDENQNFNGELKGYLDLWKLTHSGFNYNLVSVFGSQSTGKSTLLNSLFRTSFDTMIEEFRQQTTRGVWLGLGKGCPTLIMDVEGTDGRERGEDQDFERKAALFSIAISQVLLINMWESQVGLYNGANMGLLRTVFEVNLQVFLCQNTEKKEKSKTLLFFIIRDHIGKTPLEHLSDTIKRDLNKMWTEISKPDSLKDMQMTDFFDFMFFGLPHKILLPKEFELQIDILRHCFYDPKHPNYVFRPNYHKRIPADGFPLYAANVWDTILQNKDLDLPTQQQLLAQFRCDEIMLVLFNDLAEKFKPYKKPIDEGQIVIELGKLFRTNTINALLEFDKEASRYNQEVYKKKRLEMQDKIEEHLNLLFLEQTKNIKDKAIDEFVERMEKSLVITSLTKSIDYKMVTSECRNLSEKYFLDLVKDMLIDEDSPWSFAKEHKSMLEEIRLILEKKKETLMDKIDKLLRKEFASRWTDQIVPYFNDPNDDIWKDAIEIFHYETQELEQIYINIITGFEFTPSELQIRIGNLRVLSFVELVRQVKEQLSDGLLLLKLKNRLEDRFRYDKNGLPRVWKPSDDIDTLFRVAKEKTLKLLPSLCMIKIKGTPLENQMYFKNTDWEDFNLQKLSQIHSQIKIKEFETRFKKEADALYLEAKRSMLNKETKIPYWIILLIVALGWNEIMAIIKSPFYFFILVIGGLIMYVLYMLNLLTPVRNILEVVIRELMNNGRNMINQNMNSQMNMHHHNLHQPRTTITELDQHELKELKKPRRPSVNRQQSLISPLNSDPPDEEDINIPGAIF